MSYPQRVVQGLGRPLAEVELVSDLLLLLANFGVHAVRPLLLSHHLCFFCVLWSRGLYLGKHTHTHTLVLTGSGTQTVPSIERLNNHH